MNKFYKIYPAMFVRSILIISFVSINSSGKELNFGREIEWSCPQSQTQYEQSLNYQVNRLGFPQDQSKFVVILVTIKPEHFNRNDMIRLASELNRMFMESAKLKAWLLDNESIARNFLAGRLEAAEFIQAQRGLYSIDRTKCKEYIQFSSKPGNPKNESIIRIKCTK